MKEPLYLKKFISELTEYELNELSTISTLKYNEYLGEILDKESKELKEEKDEEGKYDDEGYYYERQLFTQEGESLVRKYNLNLIR